MPVFTRRPDSSLLVIFARDGEPDDMRIAPNLERALAIALVMLAHRSALYAGDRLTVVGADDADLPDVSLSAQHGS